jgi:hypothetical protein
VRLGSVGKTFNVTGWKLGWAYGQCTYNTLKQMNILIVNIPVPYRTREPDTPVTAIASKHGLHVCDTTAGGGGRWARDGDPEVGRRGLVLEGIAGNVGTKARPNGLILGVGGHEPHGPRGRVFHDRRLRTTGRQTGPVVRNRY